MSRNINRGEQAAGALQTSRRPDEVSVHHGGDQSVKPR